MGAFGVMRWGRPGGSQGRVAYLNKKVGLVEKTFGILATGAVFPVLDYLCVPGRVGRALQTLLGRAGIFSSLSPACGKLLQSSPFQWGRLRAPWHSAGLPQRGPCVLAWGNRGTGSPNPCLFPEPPASSHSPRLTQLAPLCPRISHTHPKIPVAAPTSPKEVVPAGDSFTPGPGTLFSVRLIP